MEKWSFNSQMVALDGTAPTQTANPDFFGFLGGCRGMGRCSCVSAIETLYEADALAKGRIYTYSLLQDTAVCHCLPPISPWKILGSRAIGVQIQQAGVLLAIDLPRHDAEAETQIDRKHHGDSTAVGFADSTAKSAAGLQAASSD